MVRHYTRHDLMDARASLHNELAIVDDTEAAWRAGDATAGDIAAALVMALESARICRDMEESRAASNDGLALLVSSVPE